MPRPRKGSAPVKDVEDVKTVQVEQNDDSSPVETSFSVDVKHLKELVWKNDLEAMQEAVSTIQGDSLTMQAVEAILSSQTSGIASQYLQQIIQRNNG